VGRTLSRVKPIATINTDCPRLPPATIKDTDQAQSRDQADGQRHSQHGEDGGDAQEDGQADGLRIQADEFSRETLLGRQR